MKKKLVATLGLTAVLALTFSLANDLRSSIVSAQAQSDKSTVITTEEQNKKWSKNWPSKLDL